jgi:hypothetical protein
VSQGCVLIRQQERGHDLKEGSCGGINVTQVDERN